MRSTSLSVPPDADMVIMGLKRFSNAELTSVIKAAGTLQFDDDMLLDRTSQQLMLTVNKMTAEELYNLVCVSFDVCWCVAAPSKDPSCPRHCKCMVLLCVDICALLVQHDAIQRHHTIVSSPARLLCMPSAPAASMKGIAYGPALPCPALPCPALPCPETCHILCKRHLSQQLSAALSCRQLGLQIWSIVQASSCLMPSKSVLQRCPVTFHLSRRRA